MARKPKSGPASDPELLILASLASGPKHGYAIMGDIDSFVGVTLGPGPPIRRSRDWSRRNLSRPTRVRGVSAVPAHGRRRKGAGRTIGGHAASGSRRLAEAETSMSIRHRVVAALLRLYPSAWRNEYGAELTDILLTGPFGARVIGDVIRSGLWQRVRSTQPSTFLGVASLLVILIGFVLPGGPYGHGRTAFLQLTAMTFPTVEVTFLSSEIYIWLLMGCGCWTSLRYGSTATQAGIAGMRMSLIASIPIILGGVLILLGVLDVMFFFDAGQIPRPHVLAILVAPIARLPE